MLSTDHLQGCGYVRCSCLPEHFQWRAACACEVWPLTIPYFRIQWDYRKISATLRSFRIPYIRRIAIFEYKTIQTPENEWKWLSYKTKKKRRWIITTCFYQIRMLPMPPYFEASAIHVITNAIKSTIRAKCMNLVSDCLISFAFLFSLKMLPNLSHSKWLFIKICSSQMSIVWNVCVSN